MAPYQDPPSRNETPKARTEALEYLDVVASLTKLDSRLSIGHHQIKVPLFFGPTNPVSNRAKNFALRKRH